MSHENSDIEQVIHIEGPAVLSRADSEKLVAQACRQGQPVLFSLPANSPARPEFPEIPTRDPWKSLFARREFYPDLRFEPAACAPLSLLFLKLPTTLLHVGVVSHEEPSGAIASIRLTGIIRAMERQGRIKLHHVS